MTSITRTLFVLFLTVLLGAGLIYESYMITYAEKKIAVATDSINKKVGSDSRVRNIAAAQVVHKDDLEVINETILTKNDLVALLENLQKIGREKGLEVTISSITSDSLKSASSTAPETVHVNIDTSGPWAPSLSFVRLLESLPHKIIVERANLVLNQDRWGASVTLKLTTNPQK